MRRARTKPTTSIVGELTIQTAVDVKATLLAALESSAEPVVDLSEVTEVDTAGLQVLLLARREAEHLAKPIRFVSPSQAVQSVLDITHLSLDPEGAPAAGPANAVEAR